MDGLCFSDHLPGRGIIEVKKVFEPVKVQLYNDCLEISNLYDHIDLGHLDAAWELVSNDGL